MYIFIGQAETVYYIHSGMFAGLLCHDVIVGNNHLVFYFAELILVSIVYAGGGLSN